MMAGQQSEADRLRRCRLTFETALREGISMSEARDRLARQRWEAVNAQRTIRCGTRDMGPTSDEGQTPPRWMMAE